jgi:hypothetical protein
VVAQGGTSIIGSSDAVSVVSTPRFSEWGGNAGAGGLGGLGTLLGPEGAGDESRTLLQRRRPGDGVLSYVWDRPHGRTALLVGVGAVVWGWFCP